MSPSSESPCAPPSSHRWFTDEVYSHDAQLKAHLRGSFPRVRDVDDVVQESYLRIWQAHASQPIQCARALLFTIARRLALNLIRRENRSPLRAVADLDSLCVLASAPDAASSATRAQEIELLAAAVESLPARCREIFILRKLQQVPQKEIALRLGLSEGTVAQQASKGLQRIAEYFRIHLDRP